MPKYPKKRKTKNLNEIVERKETDQTSNNNSNISVYFDRIVSRMIDKLNVVAPDAIVGCMYWFTEPTILKWLNEHQIATQIIVQKQNIWSRNITTTTTTINKKRKLSKSQYSAEKLRNAYNLLTPLHAKVDAVRCLGECTRQSSCLLHHKFLVCLKNQEPIAVFTGSFNLTMNANQNLENVLFIEDKTVAKQYWQEWLTLLPYSEPLDWTSSKMKLLT